MAVVQSSAQVPHCAVSAALSSNAIPLERRASEDDPQVRSLVLNASGALLGRRPSGPLDPVCQTVCQLDPTGPNRANQHHTQVHGKPTEPNSAKRPEQIMSRVLYR